jgi:hypothetical protein
MHPLCLKLLELKQFQRSAGAGLEVRAETIDATNDVRVVVVVQNEFDQNSTKRLFQFDA